MSARPVTIVDVAERAGVSHSTVSRVLNDHPHVSGATKRRVEQAAAELGYVANLHARGLAGGRTGVIGLVTLEVSSSYIIEVTRGVDEELATVGLDLMLSTTRERDQRECDHVLRLSQGLCDGLIVLIPSAAERYLSELADRRYPVVLIDHAATPLASSTTTLNRAGAERATTHLVELGHRRIAHIAGTTGIDAATERVAGWREALARHGLAAEPGLLVEGDFRRESGRAGASVLLDRDDPPTAIVAASDLVAIGVLDELAACGLRCPEDVSVVGFDDVSEATLATPALTTIRQPMQSVGREAVRLLQDRFDRPDGPAAHVALSTELIVRDSTGPVRSAR